MDYKPFKEIEELKNILGFKTTYRDELSSIEWQEKRLKIIKRDGSICTNCNCEPTFLENGKPHRKMTNEEEEDYKVRMTKYYNENLKLGLDSISTSLNIKIDINDVIKPHPIRVDEHIILHVHHKFYIYGKLAWEYHDDALITLCNFCHQELHNTNDIPVYSNDEKIEKLNLTLCQRCNGSGYIDKYHYHMNGICFGCDGYKYLELINK